MNLARSDENGTVQPPSPLPEPIPRPSDVIKVENHELYTIECYETNIT